MAEIFAKGFYTIVLLSLAGICLSEAWFAWFDSTVEYGAFASTKDGQETAATGNTFRRLIVQQQRRLHQLYKSESKSSKAGEYRPPGEAVHIKDVSDLGDIPKSLLDELKIEAAGVNVTSILTTLRRWVRPPNEITGSIDQIGSVLYVTANWPHSPRREGSGTEPRAFVLSTQSSLDAASFDIACRIFLARIASADAVWKEVVEDDFCAFSRALAAFQEYVNLRDRALNDSDKKAAREGPLTQAQGEIDRLLSAGTALLYVYKLGGYIDIERLSNVPLNDTGQVKTILDQAEGRFKDYLTRLVSLKADATDIEAQERVAFLAARQGSIYSEKIAASAKEFLAALVQTKTRLEAIQTRTEAIGAPLGPGASIGSATGTGAGTLCCFVMGADRKRYLLTSKYNVDEVGTKVVSPATIDAAKSTQIGTVTKIIDQIALVELAQDFEATNGPIGGLAESVPLDATVNLVGRTSKTATGRVMDTHFTLKLDNEFSNDLILTERMASAGDAGAPVLDENKKLVGIVIAASAASTVVLPLAKIFREQSLTLL